MASSYVMRITVLTIFLWLFAATVPVTVVSADDGSLDRMVDAINTASRSDTPTDIAWRCPASIDSTLPAIVPSGRRGTSVTRTVRVPNRVTRRDDPAAAIASVINATRSFLSWTASRTMAGWT